MKAFIYETDKNGKSKCGTGRISPEYKTVNNLKRFFLAKLPKGIYNVEVHYNCPGIYLTQSRATAMEYANSNAGFPNTGGWQAVHARSAAARQLPRRARPTARTVCSLDSRSHFRYSISLLTIGAASRATTVIPWQPRCDSGRHDELLPATTF